MNDRLIRGGILHSEKVNSLSWAAECLFRRLLSLVDDYGNYDGRLSIIRANAYPLKLNQVSESDVQSWLHVCEKAVLISFYEVENKRYLHLHGFGQRLKKMRSKFPPFPEEKRREEEIESEKEEEIENARANVFFTIGSERIIGLPSEIAISETFLQRTEQILMNGLKGIELSALWKEFDSKYSYYEFTNRNHFYNSLSAIGEKVLKPSIGNNSRTPKILS